MIPIYLQYAKINRRWKKKIIRCRFVPVNFTFDFFFYRWIPSQGLRKKDGGEKDNYICIEIYIGMEARKSVISMDFYCPSDYTVIRVSIRD